MHTDVAVLAGPAALTATDVVADDVAAGHGVEARTALALVRVQLTLRPVPLGLALTPVAGQGVRARTGVQAGVGCTLVHIWNARVL